MSFTVMITTRNRRDDVCQTLTRLMELEPPPVEVLVCADGCNDGTATVIRTRFPSAKLIENESPQGSVPSRDRMLRLAVGDWVLSLDDDSYPQTSDFLVLAAAVIGAHPEAAVITFPEQRDGGIYASPTKRPGSPGHYVSAYPNCAALIRRRFYLQQPGFPLFFVHMYEEPDYALQCYAAGGAVWFEPSLIIRHHLSSAQRQPVQRHHQNARNELWSVWVRCPWPWLPLVSIFRISRQFCYACTEGFAWAIREPAWWFVALRGLPSCFRQRRPVTWSRYLAWMKLARHPVTSVSQLHRIFGF